METKNQPQLFELGEIAGSARADRDDESLKPFFNRHLSGDFGIVSDAAVLQNRRAIQKQNGLVLSVFQTEQNPSDLIITTSFYPSDEDVEGVTLTSVRFFDEVSDEFQKYLSGFITR